MKKRKALISKNMAAVCEDMRRQQRELLEMADDRVFQIVDLKEIGILCK